MTLKLLVILGIFFSPTSSFFFFFLPSLDVNVNAWSYCILLCCYDDVPGSPALLWEEKVGKWV